MIFTKKINLKLSFIGIIFMIFLVTTNKILIDFGLKKSIDFIYNINYEKYKETLINEISSLKDIANIIGKDDNLIHILDNNRDGSELTEEDLSQGFEKIHYIQKSMENLTLLNSISIINIKEKYVFNNDKLNEIKNFDDYKFNDLAFNEENSKIVTQIYKDPLINKYMFAVMSPITSYKNNELLGVVIVNVLLDKLIENINSNFYIGELNSYIGIGNNMYYSTQGIVDIYSFNNKNKNYVVKLNKFLDDKIDIFLEFNKDSIIYSKYMEKNNRFIILIFAILGVIYLLILASLVRRIFKPILKSLDRLKNLSNNLGNKNLEFDTLDEFEQLEVISNSLGKIVNKKLKSFIYYDELTQLANRKLLYKLCGDLIEANEKFALIFIDLNKFKYINDVFGHSAGDEVLVRFSQKLTKCFSDKGIVSRYSGDEFIVVYTNYIDNDELEAFYNNVVLQEFKEPIEFNNGKKTFMEFSAGVSVYPRDGKNFNDLINKSDFMMYSSKKINRGSKLEFFNDEIYNEIIEIENLKEDLKFAVDNNEFILYYQPIVDRNKSIKKLEALIRWNNKKLGFIPPDKFIGYAEETGEIVKIGYWIIEEVCKSFIELFNSGYMLQVSINVSPIQLMEIDFVDKIEEILNKYNVTTENLCFEITESVVLDENIIINENLLLLNKKGIKVALDDFGTGYASFSYLKKFNLDILKIDKIFIDNSSSVDFKIVNSIKNIAHILSMETVVEGVETEQQFNALSSVGCDLFQGYYFSRPLPSNEIMDYLNKFNKKNKHD